MFLFLIILLTVNWDLLFIVSLIIFRAVGKFRFSFTKHTLNLIIIS
jgi:hypothetical protein